MRGSRLRGSSGEGVGARFERMNGLSLASVSICDNLLDACLTAVNAGGITLNTMIWQLGNWTRRVQFVDDFDIVQSQGIGLLRISPYSQIFLAFERWR